jgi:hypothetical protein
MVKHTRSRAREMVRRAWWFLLVTLSAQQSFAQDTGCAQSAWEPRQVAEDELTTPRGEVEDKLRREVLAAFFDEERLAKLRPVLDSPWDKASLEYFAGLLLEGVPEEGEVEIDSHQWRAVVNLLAHVAASRQGEPLAADIRDVFDRLMRRAEYLRVHGTIKSNWWGRTTDAIRDYGNAELLTEGFWEAIEGGDWAPRVLEDVGDEEALRRVKEIRAENPRPEDIAGKHMDRRLREVILVLEMQMEYPELRMIKMCHIRRNIAERLRRMKAVKIEYLEEWARVTENEEVAEALSKLAARLKKEANEANTGN